MEIKEFLFENLITKTEKITESVGGLLARQQAQIAQMQLEFTSHQERITNELLNLASDLNKNNLTNYANRIEFYVVQHLLKASYDAKRAFATHKALFAERHEMATFLTENLAEIKQYASQSNQHKNAMSTEKIKVFTYWDNDNKLPPIVSLCRKSLKKYIPEDKFDLIILNSETYKEWTDFRKSEIKSEITQAHFTDILRVKLLEKWGGFWLDATDMLTQNFYIATQQIREQEQFIFTYAGSRTGTWFIYSKPNNYIISMWSKAISLWWDKKGYLTNYFMLHDIIEMFYWVDTYYRNQWDKMLKTHPRYALTVLRAYHQETSPEICQKLIDDSFVHKLTYKYNTENIEKNSVLEYLLSYQP